MSQRAANSARVDLPADQYRDEFLEKCRRNNVVIVSGDTGSGKSTRISQFALDTEHHRSACRRQQKNKMVVVTQPRRIAALSLCQRVAKEQRDLIPGTETPTYKRVGYAIGQDRKFDAQTARIVFVTCGWLLSKAISDPEFVAEHVSCLVLDEAHERGVDMDLLCFVAKTLLKQFTGSLKVIVMSATLDIDLFRNYFETSTDTLTISMRRFPVSIYHSDELERWHACTAEKQRADLEAAIASGRCREDPNGHCGAVVHLCDSLIFNAVRQSTTVLVFCSGVREIDDMYAQFQRIDPSAQRFRVYALHSLMEKCDQMKVFGEPSEHERRLGKVVVRVILATNIAESSVTIPNAEFVIDLGKQKTMRYNDDAQVMQLDCVDISRDSAKQRAGRTGRVCPGTVLRLYPSDVFARMDEHSPSEVHLVALENTLLRLYSLKKNATTAAAAAADTLRILLDPIACLRQLVDPVDGYSVLSAHNRLLEMGALNRQQQRQQQQEQQQQEQQQNQCATATDDSRSGGEEEEEEEEEEQSKRSGRNVDITPFGSMLAQMPLSFDQCTFLLFGAQFHRYAAHFAVMAAYASLRDVFVIPNHQDKNGERYQRMVRTTSAGRRYFSGIHRSDLLGGVEMLRDLLSMPRNSRAYRAWLRRYGIHEKRVCQFRSTSIEIVSRLAQCGFGVAQSAAEILSDRRARHGIPWHLIDRVLPLNDNDSAICSMLVALALKKNLLHSPCSDRSDATSSSHGVVCTGAQIEPFGDVKRPLARFFEAVVSEQIAPLNRDAPLSDVDTDAGRGFVRATLNFENAESARHVLGQMVYKGKANICTTLGKSEQSGGGSRYNRQWRSGQQAKKVAVVVVEMQLGNVMLGTRDWFLSEGSSVFDYPPRSPFHALLECNRDGFLQEAAAAAAEERQERDTATHPLSAVGSANYLLAVTFALTKMGRRYRAPLLSIVQPEHQLLFSLVLEFLGNADSTWRCSLAAHDSNDDDGDDNDKSDDDMQTDENAIVLSVSYLHNTIYQCSVSSSSSSLSSLSSAYESVLAIRDRAQAVANLLRDWTLHDITDSRRSVQLLDAVVAMFDAFYSEKLN